LAERCKVIQAQINTLRGFKLKRTNLIIDEATIIKQHMAQEDFSNERIERIHTWLVSNHWKYRTIAGRGDVGARVIWEEADRAELAMVTPELTPGGKAGKAQPSSRAKDMIPRWGEEGYNLADEFYPSEEEKRQAEAAYYAAH
jgi:hypothetical protein